MGLKSRAKRLARLQAAQRDAAAQREMAQYVLDVTDGRLAEDHWVPDWMCVALARGVRAALSAGAQGAGMTREKADAAARQLLEDMAKGES